MDKNIVLEKYKNQEDKILISRLFDKIELCKKSNKIEKLDFLNPTERNIIEKVIRQLKICNCVFYGGFENAQRCVLLVYPEKLSNVFATNTFDYNSVIKCIRVQFPQSIKEQYEHKTYLGGLLKLGVKREKIGDIVVFENGADVIVTSDIAKFLQANICQLIRFNKCDIDIIPLNDIHEYKQEFRGLKVVVASMRLDNIVAELANTSRNKATEILSQERVFINYENETKSTKLINKNDIVTIRGKGKFKIDKIDGTTRSGRHIVIVHQYI